MLDKAIGRVSYYLVKPALILAIGFAISDFAGSWIFGTQGATDQVFATIPILDIDLSFWRIFSGLALYFGTTIPQFQTTTLCAKAGVDPYSAGVGVWVFIFESIANKKTSKARDEGYASIFRDRYLAVDKIGGGTAFVSCALYWPSQLFDMFCDWSAFQSKVNLVVSIFLGAASLFTEHLVVAAAFSKEMAEDGYTHSSNKPRGGMNMSQDFGGR